jgi:hypothetical protein
MFVGIHSLKPNVGGVSPIILSAYINSNDIYSQCGIFVVSGSQPIIWCDTTSNGICSGTINNNIELCVCNPGYGYRSHCVTFTNTYGTTGTSLNLSSSDPSP